MLRVVAFAGLALLVGGCVSLTAEIINHDTIRPLRGQDAVQTRMDAAQCAESVANSSPTRGEAMATVMIPYVGVQNAERIRQRRFQRFAECMFDLGYATERK